jgi:hypothetical protein
MEDLNEKLTRLLSSPEGMEKIQSMMSALGGALPQEDTPPPPPMPPPAAGGIDMAALSKVLPLLGQMNQENEDTRLLAALRPYLHGQRAERLEESMRLLKLMKLLPLLTEGGVRNGG